MSASLYRAAELLDDAVVRARWSGRSLGANLTLGETGKSMKAVELARSREIVVVKSRLHSLSGSKRRCLIDRNEFLSAMMVRPETNVLLTLDRERHPVPLLLAGRFADAALSGWRMCPGWRSRTNPCPGLLGGMIRGCPAERRGRALPRHPLEAEQDCC